MAGQARSACAAGRVSARPPDFRRGARTQRHAECRALTHAGALDLDFAAMEPDQIANNRQPEAETAVAPRGRAVRLPETRRTHGAGRRGSMPMPVSETSMPDALADASALARRFGRLLGVNLTAFDSRFHNTCCRRLRRPAPSASCASHECRIPRSLASAAGRMLSSAASSNGITGSGSSSTCSFPVVIRDMSTRSFTSWACASALRSISSNACRRALVAEVIVEQHPRPPENHVERRAQLV